MNSVISASSGEAVNGLLDLVNAPNPIVDVTYGNGTFWKNEESGLFSERKVIGGDCDPGRAKDFVADFAHLPFADGAVPTVVFDPPFHPAVGTAEDARFKTMGANDVELKVKFIAGVSECWRVTGSYLLVKCQGFVHNHKPQWMPLWAISVCGEPFEWLFVWRTGKRASGRWVSNKSLRRNHAEYLLFSKKGNLR